MNEQDLKPVTAEDYRKTETRSEQVGLALTPSEHAILTQIAAATRIPISTVAYHIVSDYLAERAKEEIAA